MDEYPPADTEFNLSDEQELPNVVIVVANLGPDDVILLYQLISCKLGMEEGVVVSESGETFWLHDGEVVYLHTRSDALFDETDVIYNSVKEVDQNSVLAPYSIVSKDRLMLRYGVKKFGKDWKYLLGHFEWSVPWMESDLEAEWNDMENEQNLNSSF
ncbi:hypothetical protein TTRE_0000679201 [Trichuris trichiura]|uniref:Uncharacterized protein n=1 Tax=Trichuris trichiura TaxID=36087 RepID=A0A077ZIN6_TRITR|nr:hypothetical protein TTRE_0000679201 [Trichuris trichiura]